MNDYENWFERGHVAIVTGASKGLGRAVARELARVGLSLVIDARGPDALGEVERELAGLVPVAAVPGDVADLAHVHRLVETAEQRFGRIDLVINNASTLGRSPLPAFDPAGLNERGTVTFLAPLDAEHPRLWYVLLDLPRSVDAFIALHGKPIRYRYVTETLPPAAYQMVFARLPGSAEMPSAGRPFSARVRDDVRAAGVGLAAITLHTGVSSAERHERPYREWFDVSAATADAVNAARRCGGRVVAVGTTVVRALESAAAQGVPSPPTAGPT